MNSGKSYSTIGVAAAVLLVTAGAYYPAWNGGLLWDDRAHLTAPALQSLSGLWRVWMDIGATQQYYPLTHSAFWLQHHLWGEATLGYHLVNILLHVASALLIALIMRRLAIPGPLFAAVLFALHPVQVESVAWISELKNTLSGVFYLAAALLYLRFDTERSRRDYAFAIVLFTCALLAKTVTATLPAALLVIFWWRRGTLNRRRDVQPLLPFFLLAALMGAVTTWTERALIGAEGREFELDLLERVLIAGRAVWFYLGKLLWPADLTFVYPRWQLDPSSSFQWIFPVAVMLTIPALWLLRNKTRAPLAVFLLFAGTLFPALGFFNVYPFRYSFVADHFQYHATIPVFIFAASVIAIALRRLRAPSPRTLGSAAIVLATPLAIATWRQSRDYVSAERLYTATLRRNPTAWMAHNNLGLVLANDGRLAEARIHFAEAARLNANVPEHHMNLGRLLIGTGELDEGMRHLQMALALEPGIPDAHSNLGVAYLRKGRWNEAIGHFTEALRLQPFHPEATENLGLAHQNAGVAHAQNRRIEEAAKHFDEAVRYRPNDPLARYHAGTAALMLGRVDIGIAHLEEALRLRPDFAEARANLERVRSGSRKETQQ